MQIVGLISGGKDSIFNLLCCKRLGFKVSLLVNLTPGSELEIDSFMYQSVGKELVPLISECLEIPLIQKEISGKALNQEIGYSPTVGDEVEDLFELLKTAIESYPNIQGVSCGAVMSNYQRHRLEEVCHRLKLQSFCFMWMLPEHPLLESIIASGLRSTIVKVASFGLDSSYLGKFVSDCFNSFSVIQKNVCSDFHTCGEGGEYETSTLDGPPDLFKGKFISIEDSEDICLDSNPFAPVYVLRPTKFQIKEKEEVRDKRLDSNFEDERFLLPFFDPEYSLYYYICDTGRYSLGEFFSNEISSVYIGDFPRTKDGDTSSLGIKVQATEGEKTFIILAKGNSEFLEEYFKEISKVISERGRPKDWFFSSKAISLDVTASVQKIREYEDRNLDESLISNLWDNYIQENIEVEWRPTINISFLADKSQKKIRLQILIAKYARAEGQDLIREACSSSISSYGTSIPRSFSNSSVISSGESLSLLGEFLYRSGEIKRVPIVVSSGIYGIVPHLKLPPSQSQISGFLGMIKESTRYDESEIRLSIELSLALRSFRCNFSSCVYSSHALSSNRRVDFRFDVFNTTHIWVIEIADERASLEKLDCFFRSLINKYNYCKDLPYKKWSSIHKFIESPKHPSIYPMIISVLVGQLSNGSVCKINPISFLLDDYTSFTVNPGTSVSKSWSFELRTFSDGEAVALLFNLEQKLKPSRHSLENLVAELNSTVDSVLESQGLSLENQVIYSKFFILEEFYHLFNELENLIVQISAVIGVKKLSNFYSIQYLLVIQK
ncbi:putative diphthine--ammonia ligase [Cryptosporidium felis]|nr:putative diphthine--ammonia ligase [Cryptosporidium felis]